MMLTAYLDAHLLSVTVFLPLATGLALFVSSALYRLLTGTLGLPALGWRSIAFGGSSATFLLAAFGLFRLRPFGSSLTGLREGIGGRSGPSEEECRDYGYLE